MSYLIVPDFKKLIQTDNLTAIIGGDNSILEQVKQAAQIEITSYLTQKYDLSNEFTDTTVWSRTVTYKGRQRVYLDAPAYVSATAYNINDMALQAGSVYICISSTTGAFDLSKWTLLGVQYAMFFVTLPYPEFNLYGTYLKNTQVWWKNSTYTNIIPTGVPSHGVALQYGTYSNIPLSNVFPDDVNFGVKSWGAPVAYSVVAGTLPNDITKWTAGDNRNQQLVNCCIDVALYTVHSRIAPRNIPDLRVKRYDDVIRWLKNGAKGTDITLDLPLRQPKQGGRIRWGSQVQKDNSY